MGTDNMFINNVVNLNKRTALPKPTRTEPFAEISEFNLPSQKGTEYDLLESLRKDPELADIVRKLDDSRKKYKTLPIPLEKPKSDRIKRSIGFDKIKQDLTRYNAIVTSNRASNYLTFPSLNDVEIETGKDFSGFRIKSELQQKLEDLEPPKETEAYNLEKKSSYPLKMQEMLDRRKEMAKMKIIEGYKAAKARRQNKIKSKKFHRIQRREKIKNQIKEFEQLQKTNPEEALNKLDEIERVRAEERASLRHRNTGKWATSKQVKAKYDSTKRQELAQQLALSRELTQKIQEIKDSESEDENETMTMPKKSDENNPWIKPIKTSEEIESFVSGYRKFWDNKKKEEEENIYKTSNSLKEAHFESPEKEDGSKSINTAKNIKTSIPINKTKRKNIIRCVATSQWAVGILSSDTDEENEDEDLKNLAKKQKTQTKSKKKRSEKNLKGTNEEASSNSMTKSNKKSKKETNVKKQSEDIEELFKKSSKKTAKVIKVAKKKRRNKNEKKKTQKEKQSDFEKLSFKKDVHRPVIDEPLNEINTEANIPNHRQTDLASILNPLSNNPDPNPSPEKNDQNIDPNNIINTKIVDLQADVPDFLTAFEEEENNYRNEAITEAFEDDDIVESFQKEKNDEIEGDKPKDINLFLPGWGSWGGPGIKATPKKRANKRFLIKFPKESKRRDDNKGNLIISEKGNDKMKSHLVSEVPFPFKTVKDYEASIRAPIGNTFVPETAFRRMIRPAVKTKMGTVIEPMSEEILLKTKD